MTGHAEAARTKAIHPVQQFDWNEEKVEELKRLVAERHSYGAIAKIMGGGLTRNAVLGKALRMKLNGTEGRTRSHGIRATAERPVQGKHTARRARNSVPAPKVVAQADAEGHRVLSSDIWSAPAGSQLIPLVQLTEHTCKWPIGDPLQPGFGFCGQHSADGSPYCPHHRRIARGY